MLLLALTLLLSNVTAGTYLLLNPSLIALNSLARHKVSEGIILFGRHVVSFVCHMAYKQS